MNNKLNKVLQNKILRWTATGLTSICLILDFIFVDDDILDRYLPPGRSLSIVSFLCFLVFLNNIRIRNKKIISDTVYYIIAYIILIVFYIAHIVFYTKLWLS